MKKEEIMGKKIRHLTEMLMARIWDNSKEKNTEKCYDDRDWFLTKLKEEIIQTLTNQEIVF